MFLLTKDEVECGCSAERYDPGLSARPYDRTHKWDARAGGEDREISRPATPLEIAEGLKDVFDPEIPVDVYDLGLVYDIRVEENGDVSILMTLTAPNCPAAGILPGEVAEAAAAVPGTRNVGVEITFDVPWNPDMMSEIARVGLGIY